MDVKKIINSGLGKTGKIFLVSFGYTVVANGISMLVSAIASLIVPKLLMQDQYGFWQLYMFYISYIGFLHFGLQDGIYLRYGGEKYEKLDKDLLHSQLIYLFISECLIAVFIFAYSYFRVEDASRKFIYYMVGVCAVVYLPNTLLQYILQMTGRIKEYSRILILEKSVYGITLVMVLFSRPSSFAPVVITDILGKIAALVYACYVCKDIVKGKFVCLQTLLQELYKNYSAGIKLLVANIASLLVIGSIRLCIERQWDIVTFGKVSLPLTLCNFFLTFILAVGQVIFPMLRRTEKEKLPDVYMKIDIVLMGTIFAIMAFYPIIYAIMLLWLPQYADAMFYFTLLFPICLYESKASMLLATFFKTMRLEKIMLIINVCVSAISVVYGVVSAFVLKNLLMAVLGITVLLAVRCIASELALSKHLAVSVWMHILEEVIITMSFIVCNLLLPRILGSAIYILLVIVWGAMELKKLRKAAVEKV